MSSSNPSSSIPGIGRAKSCTACRQLACDARQTFPSACTRCNSRKLECKFDANFKRVPTRKRLEEVTGQLNDLRASLRPGSSLSPTASATSSGANQLQESSSSQQGCPASVSDEEEGTDDISSSARWLQVDVGEETSSRCLEMIILTPETTLDLLKHFDRYYYPHIPILQPVKATSSLLESSPLLFWTIILIASRWHPNHSALYDQLSGAHERLLASIVHTSIQSVHVIHAILLLCLWPLPKIRESFDPSWNYIGLATNAALQMGLHQPLAKLENVRGWTGWGDWAAHDFGATTRALTWLACFNTGVRLSTYLGLPPPLCTSNHLNRISQICRNEEAYIPRSFAAHTEIQRTIGRFNTELDDLQDNHSHQSLTEMFDGELGGIKKTYHDVWTPQLDINLQSAKLYLYALSFTLPSPEGGSPSAQQASFRRTILQRGLMSASRSIATMSQLQAHKATLAGARRYSNSAQGDLDLGYYPKHYFTGMFFATVFLLKFLSTQTTASQFDRDSAINSITASHKMFSDFHASRDHRRGALLIEVLGRLTRTGVGAGEFELAIKTRLGASLTYDASFRAAKHRNTNPVSGAVGATNTWLSINDMEPLPFAPEQVIRETVPWLQNPGLSRSSSNSAEMGNQVLLTSIEHGSQPGHQLDQGWNWGLWDNEVFDNLMDTGFGVTVPEADINHLVGMY